MRNYGFSLFNLVSLLSVGEVIAQPVATDFRTPVWPIDQSGKNLDGYNNNANPFLALYKNKYHMGEDWNGNEGKSTDYGDLVYPMAVGKVVKALDQKGSIGKVVAVKHLLPDGQVVYSYYFHLSKILVSLNQIIYPHQPLGKIGDANGYYKGSAHLHFEIRWKNQSTSSSYYPTLTIATARKYLDPSLFLDDRATQVAVIMSSGTLTASSEEIEIPDYAPASLAYATQAGETLSFPLAVEAGWFDSTAYVRPYHTSRWQAKALNSFVFSPDEDFQIKFLKNCSLTIVVPGNNFQASRARDDMIKAADRAGFTRVKLETLTDLGDDESLAFDLRSLCFDDGPNTGVGCLVQATNHNNPLLRYIIWYEPATNTGIGDWTELDPNDIN